MEGSTQGLLLCLSIFSPKKITTPGELLPDGAGGGRSPVAEQQPPEDSKRSAAQVSLCH